MAAMTTSRGRSRKRSSKDPSSTVGHSTRCTTSSSTPAGSLQPSGAPRRSAAAARPRRVRRGRHADARRTSSAAGISTASCVKRWPNECAPEQRLLVELRQHPAHRPRIAQPAVVPAHRLGEGEAADDRVDPLRENVPQGAAGLLDPEEAVTHLELARVDAVPAREPGRGALAHLLRRALDPGRLGLLGEVADEHGQPARADEELGGLAVRSARRRGPGAAARPRSRRTRAAPRSRSQAAGSASAPSSSSR